MITPILCPEPSCEDKAITFRLTMALAAIDVVLHDHIIVGTGYYSMADAGILATINSRVKQLLSMESQAESSASYRHVSTKILNEFPEILDKVSVELGRQRQQIGLSMESPVDDPLKTIESFNRQFGLNEDERKAVEWAWPQEAGDTMYSVVNSYTRAAQFKGLPAESSYKFQRVGGNVLGMLN